MCHLTRNDDAIFVLLFPHNFFWYFFIVLVHLSIFRFIHPQITSQHHITYRIIERRRIRKSLEQNHQSEMCKKNDIFFGFSSSFLNKQRLHKNNEENFLFSHCHHFFSIRWESREKTSFYVAELWFIDSLFSSPFHTLSRFFFFSFSSPFLNWDTPPHHNHEKVWKAHKKVRKEGRTSSKNEERIGHFIIKNWAFVW